MSRFWSAVAGTPLWLPAKPFLRRCCLGPRRSARSQSGVASARGGFAAALQKRRCAFGSTTGPRCCVNDYGPSTYRVSAQRPRCGHFFQAESWKKRRLLTAQRPSRLSQVSRRRRVVVGESSPQERHNCRTTNCPKSGMTAALRTGRGASAGKEFQNLLLPTGGNMVVMARAGRLPVGDGAAGGTQGCRKVPVVPTQNASVGSDFQRDDYWARDSAWIFSAHLERKLTLEL